LLTSQGIEANSNKSKALEQMQSPQNFKDVQRLVDRLTSLSRFMLRLADKINPILILMKRANKFAWDETCENAFSLVKKGLTTPPILSKP